MPKRRRYSPDDPSYAIDFDGVAYRISKDHFGREYVPYSVWEIDPHTQQPTSKIFNPLYPPGAVYIPTPRQLEYIKSRKPHVMFGGRRGGGKTLTDLWKGIIRCHQVPGDQVIVLRRTMPQLKKTLLQEFNKVPRGLYADYNATEHMVTFHNGSVMWFSSADNENAWRQYLSGNFGLIIFDELSEFLYSMYKGLSGSCRTTIDRDIFDNDVVAQVCSTTNPGGEGGEFIKALFIDKKPVPGDEESQYDANDYEFIPASVNDNPWLAEGTKAGDAYRKMLNSQDARTRAQWIDGSWEGGAGQFMTEFSRDVTRMPRQTVWMLMQKQYWTKKWISIDWGRTHHSYVAWHTNVELTGPDGTKLPIILTYREMKLKESPDFKMSEEALALQIAMATPEEERPLVTKIYLSPELGKDDDFTRARRMGKIFQSHGMPVTTPANNKREEGWALMHSLLGSRHRLGTMTVSKWMISEECPSALDSLPLLIHDPKHDGDVKKTDSLADDVGDGLRYGIASHIRQSDKPFHERVNDALHDVQDPNEAHMIHLQMAAEEKKKQKAFVIRKTPKRRPRW